MHMGTHTNTHMHAYNLPLSPSHAHTFNTCSRLVLACAGKFQRTAGVTHIFHSCIHVHMCVAPSVAVTQKHSIAIYIHTFVEIHFP